MSIDIAPRPRLVSSLRWRLSTAMSGIVVLCAVACVAGAVLFLQNTLSDRAHRDLKHTLSGVSGYMRDQRGDLLGTARLVAADPAVASDVQSGHLHELIVHLNPLYADLNVDVIDVIDARGHVFVRMEDTSPQARSDSVLSYPSVRTALRGREQVALESDLAQREAASGYALRATVPLRHGARIVGAVVAGRQLGSIYADRLRHALNVDVNLIAGGLLTGTTVTDSNGLSTTGLQEPPAVLRRIESGKTTIDQVNENGQTILSGIVPLQDANGRPVGGIEVVSSLSPLYDLITQLSYLLIALGAGVVVLGTLLALAIARRLTRRLLALESTASYIAEAAHTDAPMAELHPALDASGDDEVASLARSLSAMMEALDQRMLANTLLYEAAQARVRELTGLAEIARLMTGVGSVRGTLDLLSEQVARLIKCSAVAILLPPEEGGPGGAPAGQRQLVYGGYGLPERYDELMNAVLAVKAAPELEVGSQAAMRSLEIVWRSLDDFPENLPEPLNSLVGTAHAANWHGATSVPLRVQGRGIGILTCYTTTARPFSDSDLSLLKTVADQVAVAVQNARLSAESRELAALEERARLARELHDSVTQALFSMTLHARAAQLALAREGIPTNGPVGQGIRQLLDLTHGALAEMRALIFELRPGALSEEGLAVALRKHAAAVSAREGLAIDVEADDERCGLDPAAEEHLYRLSQEALHNVVKHATATHVLIRVRKDGHRQLTLEIVDNGAGFDPDEVAPGHLGLGTMADRARQVGGSVEIISAPGGGTTILARVPLTIHTASEDGESHLSDVAVS